MVTEIQGGQEKTTQSLSHQNFENVSHGITVFSSNVQKLINKQRNLNIAFKYSLKTSTRVTISRQNHT